MYFGYETMWTFTFVPVGVVLVVCVGIALALVFAVGARWGRSAAERYAKATIVVLVAGVAADLLFAAASGQLTGFIAAYGYGPMVEFAVLAAMLVGSMWMMVSSYLGSTR